MLCMCPIACIGDLSPLNFTHSMRSIRDQIVLCCLENKNLSELRRLQKYHQLRCYSHKICWERDVAFSFRQWNRAILQHRLQKACRRMPSTVLVNPTTWTVQPDTSVIGQRSMSPVNTPTSYALCFDTPADIGLKRSVCQHSPIAEAAVAQSQPIQPRQLNRSDRDTSPQ
jgi:hypothetical protein